MSANPVGKVLHIGRLGQSFPSLRTGEFAKRDRQWHSATYRPRCIALIGEVLNAAFRSLQRPSVRDPIGGVGRNKIALQHDTERRAERHEPTFAELSRRHIDEHSKTHKRSWVRDERRLARCKAWDGRRISDICAVDVLKLQQKIAQEHDPVEANCTIELLRAVFNQARRWG